MDRFTTRCPAQAKLGRSRRRNPQRLRSVESLASQLAGIVRCSPLMLFGLLVQPDINDG